jgi:hypothetical protein
MGWKSEAHQGCNKMFQIVGGGQERCIAPTLANNRFCWEHQPTADGKPQSSAWSAEQIDAAWVCSGVRIVNDRIVVEDDQPEPKRDDEPDSGGGMSLTMAAGA